MSKFPDRLSNQNALRHGIYANEVVLPWESVEEFIALQSAVLAELNPQGPMEEEFAFDIARLMWLKRRTRRAYQVPFLADPLSRVLAEAGPAGWPALVANVEQEAQANRPLIMTGPEMLDWVKAKIRGETPTRSPPPRQSQYAAATGADLGLRSRSPLRRPRSHAQDRGRA